MRRFLQMLLAVLLCTTSMCTLGSTSIYADQNVSAEKNITANNVAIEDSTNHNPVQDIKSTLMSTAFASFSDEDVYLAAQLVHHEAHNQAYNGKVAIAEVVLNRINSTLFPNTIEKVVFQSGQFTNVRRIRNINPTEEELRIAYNVLNGTLRVLKDSDVLYFRNPKTSAGVSAKVEKNWGSLDYYTYVGDHAFYTQEAKEAVEVDKEEGIGSFLPSGIKLANLFGGKKSEKAAKEDKVIEEPVSEVSNTENVAEVNIPVVTEETVAVETADVTNPEVVPAQIIAEAPTELTEENASDEEAIVLVKNVAEVVEEVDDEEESVVVVDSTVMLGEAEPIAMTVENDSSEISVGTEAEKSAVEEELDDFDEDDPVAIARRRALMEQKAEVERKAREIEAQNAANASAQEKAAANDKAEVEKIARLTEQTIKATQAAVEQAKENEKNK